MDVTRTISNILPPPAKRNDGGALQFARKSTPADQDDVRVEEVPSVNAQQRHARDEIRSEKGMAQVPVRLREIHSTFTSSRAPGAVAHTPYSAPFLAQQLAQQDDTTIEGDSARVHRQAISAYDNSLNLTATVIGFEGHSERIA